MSLWTKAQQLQGDALQQVRAVYGEHFPIEVRHFLAAWIEEKMWTDIDPENPQHEQYVAGLVTSLIQELETKAQTMTTEDLFLTKLKLIEAANMFRQRYVHNPLNLFRIIRHCLSTEMKLVQQVENLALGHGMGTGMSLVPDSSTEIAQQLDFLRRRTQETGEDLRKMEQEQEAFALQYHECTKLNVIFVIRVMKVVVQILQSSLLQLSKQDHRTSRNSLLCCVNSDPSFFQHSGQFR